MTCLFVVYVVINNNNNNNNNDDEALRQLLTSKYQSLVMSLLWGNAKSPRTSFERTATRSCMVK